MTSLLSTLALFGMVAAVTAILAYQFNRDPRP